MKILVTGVKGMIGKHLVKGLLASGYKVIGLDKFDDDFSDKYYFFQKLDIANRSELQDIIYKYKPDRIIHLAALAHATNGKKFKWKDYKHLNIDCAKNVFEVAGDIPILFISTVDVFGFVTGIVNEQTPMRPVTFYGKSKMLAEQEVSKKKYFDIFRLSPVYTDEVKRDIQKRYYLKYPNIAYIIGKGSEYEVLNVNKAVKMMINWCSKKVENKVHIIKDDKRMWTPEYINLEKKELRAKLVIKIPFLIINLCYIILRRITGENKYTYLLNKALYPLRSE